MAGEAATRFIAITGLIATIALSGCGGGDSSTTTTPLPDQTGLDWSRCAESSYLTSTSGMSCQAADRFISRQALGKAPTGGSQHEILRSDPRNFSVGAFACTLFPEQGGFGWHALCDQGTRHVSFYITP